MPEKQSFFDTKIKFDLKTLIVLLLFIIGLYFLIPKLVGVEQALKLLLHLNKTYLFIAIFFEFLSYVGAAWLLGVILDRLGSKIGFWTRFKIGSIAAFAIHFFPVGSFGQGAVDYVFLRKEKVEPGSILLMLILRAILTYAAFLIIFLVGLVLVPTVPQLPLSPKLISLIIFVIVAGCSLYLFYLYKNKKQFRKLWSKFIKLIDVFLSKLRKKKISAEEETEMFEDIYKGLGLFGGKKRYTAFAILAGIVYWLADIVCFYFVFLAFGYKIHWGILIFGYSIASLLGMISFIPGGLGVTEGAMGLMYTALGVPGALAVMSVLVFRLFSFWSWIPVGLYSFITLSKKK